MIKLRDFLVKEGYTFEHVVIEYHDGSIEREYLECGDWFISYSKADQYSEEGYVVTHNSTDLSFFTSNKREILVILNSFYEIN